MKPTYDEILKALAAAHAILLDDGAREGYAGVAPFDDVVDLLDEILAHAK